MIGLSVHKNGRFVCNAGLPELAALSSRIHGGLLDGSAASFDVAGMQDLPGGRLAHVYWAHATALDVGDSLVFVLINSDAADAPIETVAIDSVGYFQEQQEYDAFEQGHRGPEPLAQRRRSSLEFRFSLRDDEVVARLPAGGDHMVCLLAWHKGEPDICRVVAQSSSGTQQGAASTTTEWLSGELRVGDSFEVSIHA